MSYGKAATAVLFLSFASWAFASPKPPDGTSSFVEKRDGIRMLKVVPKPIKRAWVLATLRPTKTYGKDVDAVLKECSVPEKEAIRFRALHAVAVEGSLGSERSACLRSHSRVAQVETAVVPKKPVDARDTARAIPGK